MVASSQYSRHSRTVSPPLTSTTYSNATAVGPQKMNVVTRVVIEGKSKQGWDGAAIKMYLKISIPLDSVTPGSTIALFPEGNLKVLDSQVHPLDTNSVPYNFSSTMSPMLHQAAGALNLPARSSTHYVPPTGMTSSTSGSIPPLDSRYTGDILVSGYHISYVLPKEFPRRENDKMSRRSASVMHFMAAIDLWVPFVSKPPYAPYLLSISVPRCLSNHIKLRIFPPGRSAASSYASLSSADEGGGAWELMSDPHVTRSQSSRLSRTNSYNNFADDESSDASTSAGFAEGCGIQGSFPSTDRIRVRWASPVKSEQILEAADGRRRVGIREVKGEITCAVLGADKGKGGVEGVLMRLEYTASCKGVWFPGVATLLGMDVGLEADDCDIIWAPEGERKWTITGGAGFTGFAAGRPPPPTSTLSRQSSADYTPSVCVLPSSPDGRPAAANGLPMSRVNSNNSTGSSSSLLRAPLPAHNVADYSFESTPVSTPTGTVSSLASLTPASSSPERSRRRRATSVSTRNGETDTDIDPDADLCPPKVPITVHLNMNELLPPSKGVFTFNISGTVLVYPRHSLPTSQIRRSSPNSTRPPSDDEDEKEPITVPIFRVFYTDKESTSTAIRNETEQSAVHVYNTSSQKRDGKVLRTVLARGNQISCGTEGARIAVQSLSLTSFRRREDSEDSMDVIHNRTRLTNGFRSVSSASRLRDISMMSTARLQPRRDGPLMIPFVTATIEPLLGHQTGFSNGYAVHVTLPAPSDADSEWLEFGLALHGANAKDGYESPRVDIASASVEGVPVRFQTSAAAKVPGLGELGLPFEETSGKEWVSWVSVHVGDAGGGKVEVIYLVKDKQQDKGEGETSKPNKGKEKEGDSVAMDILLPSFVLPVGRLQVDIPVPKGLEISFLRSNLVHEQATPQGYRLVNYALEEYHYPRLSLSVAPVSTPRSHARARYLTLWTASLLMIVVGLAAMVLTQANDLRNATSELNALRQVVAVPPLAAPLHILDQLADNVPETVTVTTTIAVTSSSSSPSRQSNSQDPTTTTGQSDVLPTLSHGMQQSFIPSEIPLLSLTTSATAMSSYPTEQYALAIVHAFPWSWPTRFSLPTLNIPDLELSDSTRTTMTAVMSGMGTVWQLLRKIMHYPLDPP